MLLFKRPELLKKEVDCLIDYFPPQHKIYYQRGTRGLVTTHAPSPLLSSPLSSLLLLRLLSVKPCKLELFHGFVNNGTSAMLLSVFVRHRPFNGGRGRRRRRRRRRERENWPA